MKRLVVLAALLIAALAAGPVLAQSLVGSIEGTVTDQQGGALPGATVTLTGKMGAKTAVTGDDGAYRFQALEPGDYTVSASIGFAIFPQDADDATSLLSRADSAMYCAKRSGKARAVAAQRKTGHELVQVAVPSVG